LKNNFVTCSAAQFGRSEPPCAHKGPEKTVLRKSRDRFAKIQTTDRKTDRKTKIV